MRKRMKRSERAAFYEKLKTVIICLLCAGCIYFTYKVVDLQYRPLGAGSSFWYSANSPVQNSGAELTAENTLRAYLEFSKPELVMINRGESRGTLKKDKDGYERTMDFINKAMQSVYSPGAEISKVSRDAVWKGLLKSNSIYIRFPCSRPVSFSAQFFQAKDSTLGKSITSYSEALLVPDTSSGRVCVFIPSEDSEDEIVKVTSETFAATLTEIINSLDYIDKREYAYACELNLDKSGADRQNMQLGSAVLDQMLVIPLEKVYTRPILGNVPWEYSHGLSFTQTTDFTTGLLNIFQYNPNTIRQYEDKDGVLMFVSGKGTLGVHPDGLLEYKALDETEGIALSPKGQTKSDDFYAPVSGLMDIMEKILNLCGTSYTNDGVDLKFTSITQSKPEISDLNVNLDYFIDGYMIQMPGGRAVEAVMRNGTLIRLKMWIKSFETVDRELETRSLLEAIDDFCAGGASGQRIKSGKLYYKFTEDGAEMGADWNIQSEQGR